MDHRDELIDELKRRGYKVTRQREAILRVFQGAEKALMTAQELFNRVILEHPGTNFSTVYRNLEILLQEGIIVKVELDREAAYYELSSNGEHHHHLICKGCGSIRPTKYCPFKEGLSEDGFMPVEHRFEVYGYCRTCLRTDK